MVIGWYLYTALGLNVILLSVFAWSQYGTSCDVQHTRLCSRVQLLCCHLAGGQCPGEPGKVPSHHSIGDCGRDFIYAGGVPSPTEDCICASKPLHSQSVSETKHFCQFMVFMGPAVSSKSLYFLQRWDYNLTLWSGGKFFHLPPQIAILSRGNVPFGVSWLNSASTSSEEHAVHRGIFLQWKNINCRGSVILRAGGNEQ